MFTSIILDAWPWDAIILFDMDGRQRRETARQREKTGTDETKKKHPSSMDQDQDQNKDPKGREKNKKRIPGDSPLNVGMGDGTNEQ